jgi:phosphoribosylformylglycinamidine synthase
VSLYNESGGRDIDPTPVVGMLGLVGRLDRPPPGIGLVDGGALISMGVEPQSLAGSRWAWERGHRDGDAPHLDLEAHRETADLVRRLVAERRVLGLHDTADGMGVTLAEMAVRSGIGCTATPGRPDHRWLFAESSSRVVLCVDEVDIDLVLEAARAVGVPATVIGRSGGDRLVVEGLVDLALSEVAAASQGRLARAVAAGAQH